MDAGGTLCIVSKLLHPGEIAVSPATTAEPSAKSAVIHLRARPETRDLIDRAAAANHQTRTDFVLDAAKRAAESTLRDRTLFAMPPEAFDAFVAALDGPPADDPALRELLETPDPWDRGAAG